MKIKEIKPHSRLTVLINGLNRVIPKLKLFQRFTYVQEPVVLESGELVFKTTAKVLDINSSLSQFSVHDFSINSLRLSGAINSLKPTQLKGDNFKNLKNIENALDTLSANVLTNPNVEPNNNEN